MKLNKNDKIELTIDDLTSEGSAIGKTDGFAVFVKGAVPGDKILAHTIKVSKSYAVAKIDSIIEPSEFRISSDCSVSDSCGGCSFRNVDYIRELEYKLQRVNDAFLRIGHLDFKASEIIGADSTQRYRNKAQYPVYIENSVLHTGFYAYKSHRIVETEDCLLQPSEFKNGIDAFSQWVKEYNITSYSEKTGSGLLRHIYFRKGFATNQVMACAVVNANSIPGEQRLCELLIKKMPNIHSICINVNKENTNVILGKKTNVIWGSHTIEDILLGKKFSISPASFYQVNHNQCEKLYSVVNDFAQLSGKETVLDLYCGAGTIGITLADKAKELIGVEIVESAVENATHNAKLNGVCNARFICANAQSAAEKLLQEGIKPDVVIVDPPRKGCDVGVFDAIKKMDVSRIIYVSCDPATLARDLEQLKIFGYTPEKAIAVDMFPRTPHVETVVLLSQ